MLERLAANLTSEGGLGVGIDDLAGDGEHRTVVIDDNCSVCLELLFCGNDTNHSIGDVMDLKQPWRTPDVCITQCEKRSSVSHKLIHLLLQHRITV